DLSDSNQRIFPVSTYFRDSVLIFRVPPRMATGLSRVDVTDHEGTHFSGMILVRRLGVIANRGAGNILIFDVNRPQVTTQVCLEGVRGHPEDVVIHDDGRSPNFAMAGNPAAPSIELALPSPQVASNVIPTERSPSEIAPLPGTSLAAAPNFAARQ